MAGKGKAQIRDGENRSPFPPRKGLRDWRLTPRPYN